MTVPVGGEERGGGQQQVEHGVVPLHHCQLGSRVTNTVRDVHISTNLGIDGNNLVTSQRSMKYSKLQRGPLLGLHLVKSGYYRVRIKESI